MLFRYITRVEDVVLIGKWLDCENFDLSEMENNYNILDSMFDVVQIEYKVKEMNA